MLPEGNSTAALGARMRGLAIEVAELRLTEDKRLCPVCPCCSGELDESFPDSCPACGQRLSWQKLCHARALLVR